MTTLPEALQISTYMQALNISASHAIHKLTGKAMLYQKLPNPKVGQVWEVSFGAAKLGLIKRDQNRSLWQAITLEADIYEGDSFDSAVLMLVVAQEAAV